MSAKPRSEPWLQSLLWLTPAAADSRRESDGTVEHPENPRRPDTVIYKRRPSGCPMHSTALQTRLPDACNHRTYDELEGRSALASSASRWTRRRLLIASDTLALVLASLVSYALASTMPLQAALQPSGLALLAAALPLWLVGVHLSGRYRPDERPVMSPSLQEQGALGFLVVIGTGALLLIALTSHADGPTRDGLVIFAACAVAFLTTGRLAVGALARRSGGYAHTAVIVGAGDVGQLVARKLLRHPEYGINVVGFVDAPPKQWRADVTSVPIVGAIEDLRSIVVDLAVDRVIVAFSTQNDQNTLARLRPLAGLNVHVDVVTRMFEMTGPGAALMDVEGIPIVSISPHPRSVALMRVKRAVDVVGASAGLILAVPLFLWAAWRIPRESRGPVFYRQTRLGANMQEFTMLKFRTMTVDTDQSAHRAYIAQAMNGGHNAGAGELYKLDRRDAVTPTGRWLRRTSLDELPQLINVLQGKMSLVGPRPCLQYETAYFAQHHFERFLAPPGITGLWQVTARAHASFAEALEMDAAYVRDWSLGLDLSLILRTPVELFRQRRATV
jgi:exopolysaccharide biosynthesis polyprenyl glycosylphosphotransferase